jgi:hypothetical protein
VENLEGGAGTRDSHWRLAVLNNELMTGYLSDVLKPLSRLTVASFEDLGYEVNEQAADAFQLGGSPAPARIGAEADGLHMGDDVIHGPIYVIGPDGRPQGVLGN